MIRFTAPGFGIEMNVEEGPPSNWEDPFSVSVNCKANVYAGGLTGRGLILRLSRWGHPLGWPQLYLGFSQPLARPTVLLDRVPSLAE